MYRTAVLDVVIVGLMAAHYQVSRQVQAEQILKWDYDHMRAIYFLLFTRKQVNHKVYFLCFKNSFHTFILVFV